MFSILFLLNLATASVTKFGTCTPEFVPELPLFRSALVREGFLTEAEAWTAELRWVLINYDSSNRLRKLTRMNRTKEAPGLVMVDSRARPLVFLKPEGPGAGYRSFDASEHPEATVWEGETRILRAVKGQWQWEDAPPARREVSDIALKDFLNEFEVPLRTMLDAGDITEAEVFGAVIQTSARIKPYVFLITPDRVFAFTRGNTPTWDKSFVAKLPRRAYAEVGRSGRRMFQRHTPALKPTGEIDWAPPLGLAKTLQGRVTDPRWRAFISDKPDEVDTLMLHPLNPEAGRLSGAKMILGRVGEDTAHVLLIPTFKNGEVVDKPFPWRVNTWIAPGDLSPSEVIVLEDGRRLGIERDHSAFRWLPRADAFEQLRAAAEARRGRR